MVNRNNKDICYTCGGWLERYESILCTDCIEKQQQIDKEINKESENGPTTCKNY